MQDRRPRERWDWKAKGFKPLVAGVYALRNTVTGEIYVGKAESFLKRWNQHFKLLAEGRHHSPDLQRSYDAHGRNAFVCDVLELVEIRSLQEKPLLRDVEDEWIAILKPALNCRAPHKPSRPSPLKGKPRPDLRALWADPERKRRWIENVRVGHRRRSQGAR